MDDTTVFSDNPVDMAVQWVAQGARRLHLVDLNGAFEGKPMNAASVTQIVSYYEYRHQSEQADQEMPIQSASHLPHS
jgi:phosphoribosylformimino-5-aminoimidazole carboxamide ribonucleotide (ProFAR) isomerase